MVAAVVEATAVETVAAVDEVAVGAAVVLPNEVIVNPVVGFSEAVLVASVLALVVAADAVVVTPKPEADVNDVVAVVTAAAAEAVVVVVAPNVVLNPVVDPKFSAGVVEVAKLNPVALVVAVAAVVFAVNAPKLIEVAAVELTAAAVVAVGVANRFAPNEGVVDTASEVAPPNVVPLVASVVCNVGFEMLNVPVVEDVGGKLNKPLVAVDVPSVSPVEGAAAAAAAATFGAAIEVVGVCPKAGNVVALVCPNVEPKLKPVFEVGLLAVEPNAGVMLVATTEPKAGAALVAAVPKAGTAAGVLNAGAAGFVTVVPKAGAAGCAVPNSVGCVVVAVEPKLDVPNPNPVDVVAGFAPKNDDWFVPKPVEKFVCPKRDV